jgi:hypothetical protein
MKKIHSILLTVLLVFNGFGVSVISLRNISSPKPSILCEYDSIIHNTDFLSSFSKDKNSINENYLLNCNCRIYGFIKYSNGSNVINSTVLLWEGLPWGFSNLPDDITNTDSNGYYEFENLGYGRYHIDPAKIGFKIGEKNVVLNEDNPEIKLNFTAVKSIIYESLIILFLLLIFIFNIDSS